MVQLVQIQLIVPNFKELLQLAKHLQHLVQTQVLQQLLHHAFKKHVEMHLPHLIKIHNAVDIYLLV